MKTVILTIVLLFCHSDCAPRKPLAPLDKHVNVDFINMEGGGGQKAKTASNPSPTLNKPSSPVLTKPDTKPSNVPITPTAKPGSPIPPVASPTAKPESPVIQPGKTASVPSSPANSVPPTRPNSPALVPSGGSTAKPGSGNVQQLITYYDSKGQASVIRPYSYADAVKKNKN